MVVDDADDLVVFEDVRVIRSTAPALLCAIGGRHVWLPRRHISGKLWCTGDRGKLFIRRWVVRDRRLTGLHGAAVLQPPDIATARPRGPGRLHLVRGDSEAHRADQG